MVVLRRFFFWQRYDLSRFPKLREVLLFVTHIEDITEWSTQKFCIFFADPGWIVTVVCRFAGVNMSE